MDDNRAKQEIKNLIKENRAIKKNADAAISSAFGAIKDVVGAEKYPQIKDLTSRMLAAQIKGDMVQVESLKKDMEKILDENNG